MCGNTTECSREYRDTRDHPRVCGEHGHFSHMTCPSVGSSPRVRGTQIQHASHGRIHRIIPACAGNTGGSGWCSRRRWDHPRVCGNTLLSTARLRPKRDHPRVCGEHPFSSIVHNPPGGSSPRVRGTQIKLEETIWSAGIIPACAGNTAHMICLELPTRDHPRVCGEHEVMQGVLKVAQGSSPRVRGTPARYRRRSSRPGIIPACAGNTSPGVGSPLHDRDHPRVCGEHRGQHGLQPVRPGSSPRVRGTPMTWAQIDDVAGIIPACAGNTCLDIALFVVHWDHPRVCGEHWKVPTSIFCSWGSSPRVRGTPEI